MSRSARKKLLDEWMVKFNPDLKAYFEAEFRNDEELDSGTRDKAEAALIAQAKNDEMTIEESSMFSVSQSVGRGGKNAPTDVAAVQVQLQHRGYPGIKGEEKPYTKTIKAIVEFQKQSRLKDAPGLVKPGSDTARALADLMPWSNEPATFPELREPIEKQTRKDFVAARDEFANLWLTSAGLALDVTPDPEDEDSKTYWWIALAGNLVWAAAVLVDPGLVEVAMSFGGAVVGSGALTPDAGAPSGRNLVSKMLTAGYKQLVSKAGPLMDEAAKECGLSNITDTEAQRQVLWGKLFKTPYNDPEPIRQQMQAKLSAALKSYQQQYKKWGQKIALQVIQGADFEDAQKANPFRPQLSLD